MADVVLLRRRNDSGVFGPERELVFFDEPISSERLAQIRTAHLWAPHDDRLERLPKVIGEMENLTSLTVSGGSSVPSLVTEIRAGDLPESLEELRLLDEHGRVLTWPEVLLPRLATLLCQRCLRVRCLGVSPASKRLAEAGPDAGESEGGASAAPR